LKSLSNQTYAIREIIVVDNASEDGTADFVERHYPNVILIRNSENCGFAEGNNIGLLYTSSDWIFLLNPDAFLEVDFIEKLMSFTQDKDQIGMLGGKLYHASETENEKIIDSVGIEIFESRRVRDKGMGEIDEGQYSRNEKVFGICAAAVLYNRKMLDDINIERRKKELFPEGFFAYFEDADLAWRCWRRGWDAWYIADAIGWHKRGGSPTGNRFSRYLTHRNRYWMIARNESLGESLKYFPQIFLHEILMLFRMIRYPYLFKALWEGWDNWKTSVQERIRLRNKNVESPPFQPGIGFDFKEFFQSFLRAFKNQK